MAKKCPIMGVALYLDCLECDDKICMKKEKPKMKIKKGDILIGINPANGEKKKYKYAGKPKVVHKNFDRELVELDTGQHIIIGNQWAKAFNLKLYKRHGE